MVPPMASETSLPSGDVTDKTLKHYESLASSGASLVIVEYTFVHESGRSEENQLGISKDEQVAGLSKIRQLIQGKGAVAGIQLTHSGAKTQKFYTGGVLLGPSPIPVPVKDQEMETPTPMSLNEIELWKEWFLNAVRRADEAGFELIELHSAHGYGLNQWLSPLTNQRTDNYGGSLENNMRLLMEIISKIRQHYPHLLISIRIPGQDFLPGGLTQADCIHLAKTLEKAGVDIINVSSGIGGWRRPRERNGQGYLVNEASLIQSELTVPVIGVGGIETGNYIDEQIQKNNISLAAVGRAILKDPLSWGQINL